METFELKRNTLKRSSTEYLILTTSLNFIEKGSYIDPVVYNSGYSYTWNIYEKYFLHTMGHNTLPCHYFIERIGEDYVGIVGEQLWSPSYWLEDLAQQGIIEYKYKHSVVVGIGFNFNIYPPDRRLSNQLSKKLICPIMRHYNLPFDRVLYIDECLKPDYKEYLRFMTPEYMIEESKYFDINMILQYVNRYKTSNVKGKSGRF